MDVTCGEGASFRNVYPDDSYPSVGPRSSSNYYALSIEKIRQCPGPPQTTTAYLINYYSSLIVDHHLTHVEEMYCVCPCLLDVTWAVTTYLPYAYWVLV